MNVRSSRWNGLVHSDNAAAYMWGGTLGASGQTFWVSKDGSEKIDSFRAICLSITPGIKGDIQTFIANLCLGIGGERRNRREAIQDRFQWTSRDARGI